MLIRIDKKLTIEESNKEYKTDLHGMFPKLMGLKDENTRKACVLFLDVEMNPFFLLEKHEQIIAVADYLGLDPKKAADIYEKLKRNGAYESVANEYIKYQSIPEYLLYRTAKTQVENLCFVVNNTEMDKLFDTENKAFERSINFGKQFTDYYANIEIAREKIGKQLQSEIHNYIVDTTNNYMDKADKLNKIKGSIT